MAAALRGRLHAGLHDGLMIVHLALAADMLGWALILHEAGESFFDSSPTYHLLAVWCTAPVWAAFSAAGSVVCVLGVLSRRRSLQLLAATLAWLFQGALAASFGGGPYVGTGFGTHLALAVLAYWAMWRVATDAA